MAKNKNPEKSKNKPVIILTLLLSFLLILNLSSFILLYKNSKQQIPEKAEFRVAEIIDGDTFRIETGEYVRLIGVDAPEKSSSFYFSSSNFLKLLILNKTIILEKDKDNRDNYGRLLRYAYVDYGNETLFINYELVKRGYAIPLFVEPNLKYKDKIEEARQTCLQEKNNLCSV